MKLLIKKAILLITITSITAGCSLFSKNQEIRPTAPLSSMEVTSTIVNTPTPVPSPTLTPTPLPENRIETGDLALFYGNYQQAEVEFNQAIENSSDPIIIASAQIGLAYVKYFQGFYNDALDLVLKWTSSDEIPAWMVAKSNYIAARCYEAMNQFNQAASKYLAYITVNPSVLNTYMYIQSGDAYYAAENYPSAVQSYSSAVENATESETISAKVKLGNAYFAQADYTNAIRTYLEVYEATPNEYTRAQMNLLVGQSYLALGLPEQAYARFQDSVMNYPRAFDSYSGLVALVEAGIEVNEFNRGLVDFYAGRYGLAIDAFNRYLAANPEHNGSAHYYKALSYRAIDDINAAISEWQVLIQDHPDDRFYVDAWEDIAYTQWAYAGQYNAAVETLLSFVRLHPTHDQAAQILYDAGRIYEQSGKFSEAAQTWGRLIDEYPQAEISSQAQFLSGISYFRLEDYENALIQFQRFLLLSGIPTDTAAGNFWIGKTHAAQGDMDAANLAWEQASRADPTDFYSERALELIQGNPPLLALPDTVLDINYEQERIIAEIWMLQMFQLPENTNFIAIEPLLENNNFQRGKAFWELGLFQEARNEFEIAREIFSEDPLNLFRMTNYFVEIGLYRSAIYSSRQILDLANLDGIATFDAPLWFNHIRFGTFFEDLVLSAAEEYNIDPLLIFSVIRQESFFEGFIISAAGARGLMQIMPATGEEIATTFNWPLDYSDQDLYRPFVNIRLGARYLARQRDFFGGDMFAALAAYNAGPGNVLNWESGSHNDPDLFLEIIPFEETRRYLRQIFEFYEIYQDLYKMRSAPVQ